MSSTSLEFNGTANSYISVPSGELSFGTGDFTIEWWQYEINMNSFPRVFSIGSYLTENIEFAFDREGNSLIYWYVSEYNMLHSFQDDFQYFDKWMHYAIVRKDLSVTIYLNGQALNEPFEDAINYIFEQDLIIGNEADPTNSSFKGLIYNFMWLKGTAKYISNFSPSVDLPSDTSPYSLIISGTQSGGEGVSFINVNTSSNIPTVEEQPVVEEQQVPTYFNRFGGGSNGQFWYGKNTNFPGFLYKKNVGVGGRRSTKFAPGGNMYCNKPQELFNQYKPSQNGIGASSIANRRAKNRLASICNNECGKFYQSLGVKTNKIK